MDTGRQARPCYVEACPDLKYVKRPAYQIRFEPQKEFFEGWITLLNPDSEPVNSRKDSYYQRLCNLLGVDENEEAEKVGTLFEEFSEDKKMECIEHVLTSGHPVWLLYPFTHNTMQAEQRQKSGSGMQSTDNQIESMETEEEEDDWNEDDTNEDDSDEDFDETETGAFNGQYGEDFEFDEQDDGESNGNEWEREEAKALAAQDSPIAETVDVDDELCLEQPLKAYAEIGIKSTRGKETVEETETQQKELFFETAVRPFTYTNLIKEAFIIRKALVDYADLRSWSK